MACYEDYVLNTRDDLPQAYCARPEVVVIRLSQLIPPFEIIAPAQTNPHGNRLFSRWHVVSAG